MAINIHAILSSGYDHAFKRLILTTSDPTMLAGFQRGFPHLFSEGPFRIEASTLNRLGRDLALIFPQEHSLGYEAAYPLRLSSNYMAIPDMYDFSINVGLFGSIPAEILLQLNGKEAKMGLTVEYLGSTFYVLDMSPKWREDFKKGEIIELRARDYLYLLPIECIVEG